MTINAPACSFPCHEKAFDQWLACAYIHQELSGVWSLESGVNLNFQPLCFIFTMVAAPKHQDEEEEEEANLWRRLGPSK